MLVGAATAFASGNNYALKLTSADQGVARAIAIRRADLRPATHWSGGLTKPDLSTATCAGYRPKTSDLVISGAAESDWTRPDRILGNQVEIFQTTQMMELDWKRAVSLAGVTCTLTKAGAKNVAVSAVAFPAAAPHVAGYRATYSLVQDGKTVRQAFEIVAVARGRAEISVAEFVRDPGLLTSVHADLVRLAGVLAGRAAKT